MFEELSASQPLEVLSDAQLAAEVAATPPTQSNTVAPKGLVTVPEVQPSHVLDVAPAEFLLELGQAVTPKLPRDDFERSARWSWLRYFWAFEPLAPGRSLRLSSAAASLVRHHKSVSSEQLAIALSLWTAKWLLSIRHPESAPFWTDADVALDRGVVVGPSGRVVLTRLGPSRMRPDYFFTVPAANEQAGAVYAVEVKGTHSDRHYLAQMRKGASQVTTILLGGVPPPSLIFSAEFNTDAIALRVLDPPAKDEWVGGFDDSKRESLESAPVEWRNEGRRRIGVVNDPDRFRSDLVWTNASGLLSFAGAYGAAGAVLPERVRRRAELPVDWDQPAEVLETPEGVYLGSRLRAPLRQGLAVEVFCGIHRAVFEAFRTRETAAVIEARQSFVRDQPHESRRPRGARPQGLGSRRQAWTESDHETYVRVASAEGATLEIRSVR